MFLHYLLIRDINDNHQNNAASCRELFTIKRQSPSSALWDRTQDPPLSASAMNSTSPSEVMSLIQHHSSVYCSVPLNSYLLQHPPHPPRHKPNQIPHNVLLSTIWRAISVRGAQSKVYCVRKMRLIATAPEVCEMLALNGCVKRTCTDKNNWSDVTSS